MDRPCFVHGLYSPRSTVLGQLIHDSPCLNSLNPVKSQVFQLWNSEATGNYNNNNNNFISALESKVKLRSVVFTSNNDPETVVGSLLGCHLLGELCSRRARTRMWAVCDDDSFIFQSDLSLLNNHCK